MQLVVQSPAQPERIISALLDLIEPNLTELRLSIAYVTLDGTELLVSGISRKLGELKWRNLKKRMVTCFDYGITEPEALRNWCSLPNSTVLAQNAELVRSATLIPKAAFHAKSYEFRAKTCANLLVGSANLSGRAMVSNSEAAIAHKGVTKLAPLNAAWATLLRGATPVDSELIAAYAKLREKRPPPVVPPLPSPVGGPIETLWDAIASGTSLPEKHEYFWVDAGSMRTGGSSNQLELPRGANRFFGFSFTAYGSPQSTIGDVGVVTGSSDLQQRRLSWHGSNKMERIYLPTGNKYGNAVVLFRRRQSHFELVWATSKSERALAWANASVALGLLYKVGVRGRRRCGFF